MSNNFGWLKVIKEVQYMKELAVQPKGGHLGWHRIHIPSVLKMKIERWENGVGLRHPYGITEKMVSKN